MPPGNQNNQSNVAVVHHAGKLLSTGEVGWPFELGPTDLSTVGPWDFDGKLGLTMTAHPKIDPDTGRMHFFGYEFLSPKLTYYSVAPDGVLDVVSPIAVDAATMMHDFAITDRHAVFWVGPVIFDIAELDSTGGFPFIWDPTGPSKVGVMPLDGSGDQIRWAGVPLGFAFHGLNAHAEGDDVVVNLHRLPEAFGPKGEVSSYLTEWQVGTGGTDLTGSVPLAIGGVVATGMAIAATVWFLRRKATRQADAVDTTGTFAVDADLDLFNLPGRWPEMANETLNPLAAPVMTTMPVSLTTDEGVLTIEMGKSFGNGRELQLQVGVEGPAAERLADHLRLQVPAGRRHGCTATQQWAWPQWRRHSSSGQRRATTWRS